MEKHSPFPPVFLLIASLLLAATVFCVVNVKHLSDERQVLKKDLAELQDSRYGLFNAYEWKRKVSVVLAEEIENFELTEANREQLKAGIERAMNQLLDEMQDIIEQKQAEGNEWSQILKRAAFGLFEDVAFGIDDLRGNIPDFAEAILAELDNPETRRQIQDYLMQRLGRVMEEKLGKEDLSTLNALLAKYDCPDTDICKRRLEGKIATLGSQLWYFAGSQMALVSVMLLLWWAFPKGGRFRIPYYYLLILGVGALLYGGIATPMIDIDARIQQLSFDLMGQPVAFEDQVLFFQSKSILDVVGIMIGNGAPDTVAVGLLILLFSVLFPIGKLLASAAVKTRPALGENKILGFLAFKSGKWSMADVMVVAIFMSYIGFRGILRSQLADLESANDYVAISTSDYSALQVGFALFLAFCLLGLLVSPNKERV